MSETNFGLEQAKAQLESIKMMVAAISVDYDRLEELKDEENNLESIIKEDDEETNQNNKMNGCERAQAELDLREWLDENQKELDELLKAAGDCESEDDARQRIQEDPLEVSIRSGWYSPGETPEPEEFLILLCTGGPAVRILGELDEHNQPSRAWIQYQDWFTAWTDYIEPDTAETILTYCQEFYFGD